MTSIAFVILTALRFFGTGAMVHSYYLIYLLIHQKYLIEKDKDSTSQTLSLFNQSVQRSLTLECDVIELSNITSTRDWKIIT